MTKTFIELEQLKKEYESLNNKLINLSEDELKLVIGGVSADNKNSPFFGNNIPGLETIGPTTLSFNSVNVNEVLTSKNKTDK